MLAIKRYEQKFKEHWLELANFAGSTSSTIGYHLPTQSYRITLTLHGVHWELFVLPQHIDAAGLSGSLVELAYEKLTLILEKHYAQHINDDVRYPIGDSTGGMGSEL